MENNVEENMKRASEDINKLSSEMANQLNEAFKGLSNSLRDFTKAFKSVTNSFIRSSFQEQRVALTKKYVLAEFRAKSWWVFKWYWRRRAEVIYNKLCMLEKYAANFEKLKRTPWRLIIPDLKDFPEEGVASMEVDKDGVVYSYLTQEQYSAQLDKPDSFWKCPVTKLVGWFDDAWYESTISHYKDGKLDFE